MIKPNKDNNYMKIRSISTGLYLTSDSLGRLTIQEENENDHQLWLILPDKGLIQNKRTGLYLKTDPEGNVNTFEDLKNDFNKWKLLLPTAKFTIPSKVIKTPFGDIEITESNKDSCKSLFHNIVKKNIFFKSFD